MIFHFQSLIPRPSTLGLSEEITTCHLHLQQTSEAPLMLFLSQPLRSCALLVLACLSFDASARDFTSLRKIYPQKGSSFLLPFFVALMRSLQVLILSSAAICFPLFGSESFEGNLQDIFDSSGLPGLAVGVIKEGKNDSHYLFGHSELSRSEKTTSETRFRVGSISKLLTSLLALRLQEKGELKLTDLINEELPDHLIGPGASEVTLAHLLEHTSGLAGSSYREYATNKTDLSPTDYLKQEAPFKLRWEPGLHYSYSNPGYTIAAGYIEQRLGIDFDTLMQREMFAPLGMKASSFSTSTTPVAESPAPRWEMPIRPAGSLVTSIPDLVLELDFRDSALRRLLLLQFQLKIYGFQISHSILFLLLGRSDLIVCLASLMIVLLTVRKRISDSQILTIVYPSLEILV